jgi:ATP-dependent Clp protease ATP-binding subunit ClpC
VPTLEHVIFIVLVGFAVGLWLELSRRRKAAARSDAPVSPAAEQAPAPDLTAQAALTARLHELENGFAPFTSSSAHPGELLDHREFKQAADLLADPAVPLPFVMQYAHGVNWQLACVAFAALKQRADCNDVIDQVVAQFDKLAPWTMYFALEYFLTAEPRPPVGAAVAGAKDWWCENPILPLLMRDYFERRADLGDAAGFGPALDDLSASAPQDIRNFLQRVDHGFADDLVAQLDDFVSSNVDRGFLKTFGRFWADQTTPLFLVSPQDWGPALAAAETTLQQATVRSLLVSGEPLVGKTSFLRLLAERLVRQGWGVFEASGADLMAGQMWFGQLEGRIREVIDQLTVTKKLIWYIPDLLQLARSGTHQGQSASILDQILPAIVSGRLVVWTEATPTSVTRLLQVRPALRSIFDVVELESRDEAGTLALARDVVQRLAEKTGRAIDSQCADVAVASARQYLGAAGFPGSALQLVKLTVTRAEKGTDIASADVLTTLSQLTGLPVSILDNKERLDLTSIRAHFASRVIGQDEAVASVVERIAMLKAGLNDPGRPIGVFLFAGPTGTGKTELAKSTAEYLFGADDRLIRLDMSEFQTPESMAAILGNSTSPDTASLITSVRRQPFSVILLDEFEKAHPRIWDMFLQVFDDARLTDVFGQTADFRHCLIIMTTNLGATSHQTAGLGFAPAADEFTPEQVHKAISQTYRPEFQNRIDKIIVFRPLTRGLMRVILMKELDDVLERRGLKNRAWAVEWEASALEFLLEKGFSPEMGARPLKRAIEQYVIAPLAATIVEWRFPEGEQFVFFRSNGRAIQAEFVDPDSEPAPPASPQPDGGPPVSLPSMILAARGSAEEFDSLMSEANGVEQALAAPDWEALKQSLSGEMSDTDFWQKPERFERLARLALMDRVAAAAKTAESLRGRLARGAGRRDHYSRELMGRLALQLHLVKEGVRDVFEGAAVEVAIMVEPALRPAGGSDALAHDAWCRQLFEMYRGWSSGRHMQVAEIQNRRVGGSPMLLVSGFGAHRVLARECGLHVLELAESDGGASRVTARVRLAVPPLGDVPAAKMQAALAAAFEHTPASSAVVRRYRSEPSPLVRSADGSWRSGRLDAVLRGDFDLMAAAGA